MRTKRIFNKRLKRKAIFRVSDICTFFFFAGMRAQRAKNGWSVSITETTVHTATKSDKGITHTYTKENGLMTIIGVELISIISFYRLFSPSLTQISTVNTNWLKVIDVSDSSMCHNYFRHIFSLSIFVGRQNIYIYTVDLCPTHRTDKCTYLIFVECANVTLFLAAEFLIEMETQSFFHSNWMIWESLAPHLLKQTLDSYICTFFPA